VRPFFERSHHLVTPILHTIGDGKWRENQGFGNGVATGRLPFAFETSDSKIKAAARPRAKILSAHWVGTARPFFARATARPSD
jgi:hypothetical protein